MRPRSASATNRRPRNQPTIDEMVYQRNKRLSGVPSARDLEAQRQREAIDFKACFAFLSQNPSMAEAMCQIFDADSCSQEGRARCAEFIRHATFLLNSSYAQTRITGADSQKFMLWRLSESPLSATISSTSIELFEYTEMKQVSLLQSCLQGNVTQSSVLPLELDIVF